MEFNETWNAIGAALARHVPHASECHEWNIRGWKFKVQDAPAQWVGTYDPEHAFVLPAQKKAGITTHIWDPRAPDLLRRHEDALTAAGFKVMVGCLQWNRKAPYPVDAIEKVFADMAQS